jgi:hypothetical protein
MVYRWGYEMGMGYLQIVDGWAEERQGVELAVRVE